MGEIWRPVKFLKKCSPQLTLISGGNKMCKFEVHSIKEKSFLALPPHYFRGRQRG
jgi:hypothetical protein